MISKMELNKCCICSSKFQNCVNCECVKQNRKCTNCRKGVDCKNRGRTPQAVGSGNSARDAAGREEEDRGYAQEVEPTRTETEEERVYETQQSEEQESKFWQKWEPQVAESWLENAYRRIISFTPGNIFTPPKCNATKSLIEEMTLLVREYTNSSPIASLVFKILAILINLICQITQKLESFRKYQGNPKEDGSLG